MTHAISGIGGGHRLSHVRTTRMMISDTLDQTTIEAPPPSMAGAPVVSRVTGFGAAGLSAEWAKYCGYLDFTMEEFKEVQARLLQEQMALIAESPLGRKLLKGRAPETVAEFKSAVPLTDYGDYVSFFDQQADASLGGAPHVWAHTTGAQAGFKWVPYTGRGLERLVDSLMGAFILAAAERKGQVNVRPTDTVLYNTPARPYVSGLVTFGMTERFGFQTVLSPETSERMDFKEKIRASFRAALGKHVDIIISMTSVLSKVGRDFSEQSRGSGLSRSLLRPRALNRLIRAFVKRKLFRMQVLPKDLWPTKAILGWGIDTRFFRDQVEQYWGRRPFEIYACTEGGLMASETWDRHGLVFNPYADLYEFISMEDSLRSREDERFVPPTVLIDRVEPGEAYEVVITNFYGMGFVRYRVGHFIRFLPREEQSSTLAIPQFEFEGRSDDRIDLAGFTRLDAKTVWEALGQSGYAFQEWTVRKELEGDAPVLHMYLQLDHEGAAEQVAADLDAAIQRIDPFYGDLENMLGIHPLRVTLLRRGTFERFYDSRQRAGYELELRTPPKMNATDEDIEDLLAASAAGA